MLYPEFLAGVPRTPWEFLVAGFNSGARFRPSTRSSSPQFFVPVPGFGIALRLRVRKNDSETSSSSPVFVPVPGFCHAIPV